MYVVAGLYVERERGRERDAATEGVSCCLTICGESEREREILLPKMCVVA